MIQSAVMLERMNLQSGIFFRFNRHELDFLTRSANMRTISSLVKALDLCYAHPNGPNGMYHYHTWSECLSPCTGESQLVGVALDGFPIFGPGINPETGLVWSQSDMDACGGRDDENGNYGYYTTVDFPYVFQCYRGEIGNTSPSIRDGNCGLYGTNCDYSGSGGAGAPGERDPSAERIPECCRSRSCGSDYTCPPKPNRKKRSTTDPFSNPTQAGFLFQSTQILSLDGALGLTELLALITNKCT